MRFKDFHPNIKIRIITSFLSRFVSTMIFPFIAIYFAVHLGTVLAGVLLMINIIATIITSFYGGYISDTFGRKKIMVISQGIQVFAFAVMAFANSPFYESPWLTFYMMLLQSIAVGLMGPAIQAMLIDVSTKENRKYMYSINFWAVNLSYGLGVIFGGLFFKTHRFELFIALTIAGIITWILVSFFMTESYIPKEKKQEKGVNILKEMKAMYLIVLKDRLFLLFSLASMLTVALEFQTINYIGIRLEKEFVPQTLSFFQYSIQIDGLKMLSWIRVENTFVIVALTTLIVAYTKRFKDANVLYVGVAMYAIGYAIQAFSNHAIILLVVVFVASVGELIYVPIRQAYLADLVNEEQRSSYMAVDGFVFQGAKLIGAGGVIIGALLPSWMMAILFLSFGLIALYFFAYVINIIENKKLKESA